MADSFGALLKQLRTDSKISQTATAMHLGVTVTYLSDVERGRRCPLTRQRILAVAEFLKIDPHPLFVAAVHDSGAIRLEIATTKQASVGARLAAHWDRLTEKQLAKLEAVLNG